MSRWTMTLASSCGCADSLTAASRSASALTSRGSCGRSPTCSVASPNAASCAARWACSVLAAVVSPATRWRAASVPPEISNSIWIAGLIRCSPCSICSSTANWRLLEETIMPARIRLAVRKESAMTPSLPFMDNLSIKRVAGRAMGVNSWIRLMGRSLRSVHALCPATKRRYAGCNSHAVGARRPSQDVHQFALVRALQSHSHRETERGSRMKAVVLLNIAVSGVLMLGMGSVAIAGAPIPVKQDPPSYPADAARRGLEGFVEVEFVIGADGKVGSVNVLKAQPPRVFEREAVRAVKGWTFQPSSDGETRVKRRIDFKL
ncbi:MAG: energy transducer TonB [Dechloromonas sp.]|nr:MAG: energy transducer TonB [Dechloromonas sp.]